jgi:hypothetical protein
VSRPDRLRSAARGSRSPGTAGGGEPSRGARPTDASLAPGGIGSPCGIGGWVEVARRGAVTGGGCVVVEARGGSSTPVGGALRARRGGSGGNRRPHDWHTASSSAFSALQNGQNRISYRVASRW